MEKRDAKSYLALLIWWAVLFFGFLVSCAVMESRTYNRLCGGNLSAWDAMWVTARVDPSCTR